MLRDKWERLVVGVVRREQLRQGTSSFGSTSISRSSFRAQENVNDDQWVEQHEAAWHSGYDGNTDFKRQKISIRVSSMKDIGDPSKALRVARGVPGVESAALIDKEQNYMEVVGVGIDSEKSVELINQCDL